MNKPTTNYVDSRTDAEREADNKIEVTVTTASVDKPTTLRESLGAEIMKEIDFLCDHWIEHDNKAPYSFGGWRGEVQEKLVDIYLSKLTSHNTELVSKIEEEIVEIRKIWESYDEYEKIINIAKIETLEKVINLIKEKNKSGTDGSISGYGGRGGDGSKV